MLPRLKILPFQENGVLRKTRCGFAADETANTVSYCDLRTVLEAGYWTSLEAGTGEPIHFAVLNSHCGKRAVETFTAPFLESWHRRFPDLSPTLIVLGINRAASGRGQDLATRCARVVGKMADAAVASRLAAHDWLEHAAIAATETMSSDLNYELSMPLSFIPFGVLGVAYASKRLP